MEIQKYVLALHETGGTDNCAIAREKQLFACL